MGYLVGITCLFLVKIKEKMTDGKTWYLCL